MIEQGADAEVPVLKDESNGRRVPSVWRPVLLDIVNAFIERDYLLSRSVFGVSRVSAETATQIKSYIEHYVAGEGQLGSYAADRR